VDRAPSLLLLSLTLSSSIDRNARSLALSTLSTHSAKYDTVLSWIWGLTGSFPTVLRRFRCLAGLGVEELPGAVREGQIAVSSSAVSFVVMFVLVVSNPALNDSKTRGIAW
jgi:hypothetical protein